MCTKSCLYVSRWFTISHGGQYTTFATEPVDWKKPASDLLGTMGNLVDDEVCGVWVVKESDSLHKPLEWLSKGVHRFIVQTTSGPKILSQSDLVKFLLSAYDKFNLGNITIQEGLLIFFFSLTLSAKITHKPVTHVENPTSALDTLKKTRIYEVHGIAITDANGTLVGTLSESDLRGLKVFSDLLRHSTITDGFSGQIEFTCT